MAVKLNQHDLEFILKQIKIAEANSTAHSGANAIPVTQVRVDENGNYGTVGAPAISQPHLPYGLRTVDGTYNNLIEGRETWGASDQIMPRMLTPNWRDNEPDPNDPTQGPAIDINGPAPNGVVTNNNYGNTGDVVDLDPRLISNLIVDQTLRNPAAIMAALKFAEYDEDMLDAVAAIQGLYNAYLAAIETPVAEALDALPPDATAAEKKAAVDAAIEPFKAVLDQQLLEDYGIETQGQTVLIPNVAPDEGLSAPFNGWMTFFGQFFDHGLDLIHKGDNGTVWVPLAADDPLRTHGPDGIEGSGDEVPAHLAWMAVTRLKPTEGPGPDGVLGTADDTMEAKNKTTPFIDQNQTYTSHPSHQVFLREYAMVDGKPLATGRLLEGDKGLATWADVKAQAQQMLGIMLEDTDVIGVPLLRTDAYGEFIRDANGFPQVVYNIGPDGIPNTDDDLTVSGTPGAPLVLSTINGGLGPVRTSHAFLDDIAHNANPFATVNGLPSILQPDPNNDVDPLGNPISPLPDGTLAYDNELLDRHFITGDGRGNENIGLTAVHHVFHSEHNRQTASQKLEIIQSGDLDFVNEWMRGHGEAGGANLTQEQLDALLAMNTADLYELLAGNNMLNGTVLPWDGERIFQAARFATEMQYQHLVFEEFGRKVQPNIDLFVFNTITDVNPAIFAEFAHTVYRFGHSMLTDQVKLLALSADGAPVDLNGNPVLDMAAWDGISSGLIEAFLNPVLYDSIGVSHEQAAGAIVRGMTYVRGNAIDEFVTESLRNNLLGLPLDLAAINIARGRDAGIPSLNEARAQLYAASNSSWLKPYESWADFAANLKTPASVVNFIAAYGLHDAIVNATTLAEKREAAMLLVLGDGDDSDGVTIGGETYMDRVAFLNSFGAWAPDPVTGDKTGLNNVDLWIGGLAERVMPFGGMLGSTFNAVFELQLENLQEGDRFYYLSRTQGLNLLNELENNAFSKLIMANTDIARAGADGIHGTDDDVITHHIGIDSFARYDGVLEVDQDAQIAADSAWGTNDPFLEAIRKKVQRDDPTTPGADENYLRFTGGEHMVMGGTAGNDTIIGGDGDDGIWGGDGDDRIESGHGVDLVSAGAGDDIITDSGDTGDFLKGESGDDIIANSNGLDVLMGGDGKDVFFVGIDGTEVFGGEGDDFILGGLDHDFILGNEGDDWMEGGDGFDVLNGDNSELFFNSSILGHDVLIAGENENDFDAESGDDIMVQGESVMRNEGMFGFDWAIYKGSDVAADADMRIPFFTTVADDILRDRFDQTEAISGWKYNDIIRGDDRGSKEEIEPELSLVNHELTEAGVDRIDGLRELLGLAPNTTPEGVDPETVKVWANGNLLIGGDGGDLFEGRGGDDFIHGDAWLNVRIRITALGTENTHENEIATVDTLKHVFTAGEVDSAGDPIPAEWVGKSLSDLMLARVIKPSQLHIVREIKYDEDPSNDTDTAIFAGNRDWYEITHVGDRTYVARREMEEVDPQIDEGTDTLVGIERILFADQIYTIRQTGNYDPTGRLTISGLPAKEGVTLTVDTTGVGDLNNPDGTVPSSQVTYRWQVERNDGTGDYINIPGASGNTFTPTSEHVGLRIRVLGTYTDGGGVLEVVQSYPTDPVINVDGVPAGEVLISDMSPTEGMPLTATAAFTDPDGITDAFEEGLLTYQWQYSSNGTDWFDVPAEDGGNLRTFVPGPEVVGMYLRMKIDYTDDGGNLEQKISGVTQIVGNYIVADGNDAVINNTTGGDAEGGTTIGDDIVQGDGEANTIDGGEGNDILHGGGGADSLQGGVGNDELNGGGGDDTLEGGEGNDILVYHNGEGADDIDGGAGSDTLRIREGVPGGDDTITVALAAGLITSVNGITSVTNVEAAELHTDGGTDTLIYETTQNVSVNLLSGAATGFSFTRGVENVTSGSGNDTLLGNSAANVFSGGDGNDTLSGGFGNDTLNGGDGNDTLNGQEGDDVLEGGDGNDRIDGGAGNDTASYANASAAVTVSLLGAPGQASFEPQNTVGAGLDSLISIENLTGSAFGDTLTGDAADNIIDGGAGADTMDGGAGNDTYIVDNAGDAITDASGVDTVRTELAGYQLHNGVENLILTGNAAINGVGNALDNEITGNSANNTLNGAGGLNDAVVLAGPISDHTFALTAGNLTVTSAAGGTDTLVNIERAKIGGTSYLIVRGTNAADADATAIYGGDDADLILGFNNADELHGDGGDDILVGGLGADQMFGGTGNDIYRVQQAADLVDETGGDGIDTIYSDVNRNLGNAMQVVGDVENLVLVGATGLENLNGTGNALANVITGNEGNNILNGGQGADTLIGNGGNDTLNGGAQDDILEGGAGNDTLNGGAGTDTAVFAGVAGDYAFGIDGDGNRTVTHLATGEVDTLANIERIQFGDGQVLTIQTDPNVIPAGPALIFGTEGSDTIIGGPGNDVIIGGPGDDTLNGSDVGDGDDNVTPGTPDDDTFIWNVGDGFDTINGGMEAEGGDVFHVNGDAGVSEVFRIYTYDEAVARIGFAGSDETEIIVTRGLEGQPEADAEQIAELTEIEEIVINGAGVSGNGTVGNDKFEMYGDFFVATSLRPNTITVVGTSGDDTIDVSSLQSAHRIVFKTGGGNDVIIGTLRPQDVIELPAGKTMADYQVVRNPNGTITLISPSHTITFLTVAGMPSVVSGTGQEAGETPTEPDPTVPDPTVPDPTTDPDPTVPEEEPPAEEEEVVDEVTGPIVGTSAPDLLLGTVGNDYLIGFNGDDVVIGYGGADILIGGADADFLSGMTGADTIYGDGGDDTILGGDDNDLIYGGDGHDRIFADGGNDFIYAGLGNDVVIGGAGNDRFVAEEGDGNDTYFGDEMWGGSGIDTLDMSSISAAATVDLGSGMDGLGKAQSSATGTDTLWGIENVVTGSGNDTIIASDSANVMDGGTGSDTFVFKSIAAANGDTIHGFEAGDKIDLSAIDADNTVAGNQAFSLTTTSITSIRDLLVTHETRDDGEYTVVQGNVGGSAEPEFKISIKGNHTLTADDFTL